MNSEQTSQRLMMYGEYGEAVLPHANGPRGEVIESAIREICSGSENRVLAFTIEACDERPSPYSPGKMITFASELSRLNLWYARCFGVFCELTTYGPPTDARPALTIHQYAVKSTGCAYMTRFWMGDNCGRVPLGCFVQCEDAIAIAEHFFQSAGECWPQVRWMTEAELEWGFFCAPEDEWPSDNEPPIRPAWQISLPEFETLRQQGRDWNSYF